jgi:hypothetical protein
MHSTRVSPARTAHPLAPAELVARSLFPLVAIGLLASVLWLGPWPFLAAVWLWWKLVTVVG